MSIPKVAVGLPVYNGEPYLAPAIDSILSQTYHDLELIISDNASTDRTLEICQDYVRKDSRVRYFRQERNIGAAANYNFVFAQSSSAYFRWAAADDLLAPELLERCVGVLDADPSVVLCFPGTELINGDGSPLRYDAAYDAYIDQGGKIWRYWSTEPRPELTDDDPIVRFEAILMKSRMMLPIFGVMRSSALAKTHLQRPYWGADLAILAEMALQGRIRQVPERLFFRRCHRQQSTTMSMKQQIVWQTGKPAAPTSVVWAKKVFAFLDTLSVVPLSPSQRLRGLLAVAKFYGNRLQVKRRRRLDRELEARLRATVDREAA